MTLAPPVAEIRPARPADAARVAVLANALNREMGEAGAPWSAAIVRRDAFGPAPAFRLLVAEDGGRIVAYALFTDCYITDFAARGLWMDDIYVVAGHRGRGIGRRLVAAVAAVAAREGRVAVWWSVLDANRRARAFYAGLGARDERARVLELDGDALRRLAAEGGFSP